MLGLRLDPDPVGPLPVAAGERPQQAGEEHEPEEVAHERVRLVRLSVQELQRVGHLVVDLQQHRDDEEHQEAEVDERMHETRGGIAQQRAHPDSRSEVAQAAVHVALGRAPVVRLAALVVADPQRHEPRHDEQPGCHREVERNLERGRDVDEDFARHARVVVPPGELRREPGSQCAEGREEPDEQDNLMRPRQVPAHGGEPTATPR